MAIRPTTLRSLSRPFSIHCQNRLSSQSSSVNAAEVSHFDNLASTWWDPYGPSRLLHQMNPLRHDFISSCIESQPESTSWGCGRYLDVGCGGGIFAESAARLPQTKGVVGIDPSNHVISVAKAHARHDPLFLEPGRLEYQNKTIEDLPVPRTPEEQFDVVSLFEVIEHINWPAPFINSCLPFVKPGGWLILSTIARTWTSWLTTNVLAEEVVRLVPRGTHDWSKYINEEELRKFFSAQDGWGRNGGLKSQGCMYVPTVGWRIVPDGEKWGNYFFGVRKDPKRK